MKCEEEQLTGHIYIYIYAQSGHIYKYAQLIVRAYICIYMHEP
jgi:hypothetical protein